MPGLFLPSWKKPSQVFVALYNSGKEFGSRKKGLLVCEEYKKMGLGLDFVEKKRGIRYTKVELQTFRVEARFLPQISNVLKHNYFLTWREIEKNK